VDGSHAKINGWTVDLTYIPVPKFVLAYNACLAASKVTGHALPVAFESTSEHWIKLGLCRRESDGTLSERRTLLGRWIDNVRDDE
jgi:hypothetical protein